VLQLIAVKPGLGLLAGLMLAVKGDRHIRSIQCEGQNASTGDRLIRKEVFSRAWLKLLRQRGRHGGVGVNR